MIKIIVILLALIVAISADNLGTCGGSCTSSATCASSTGDVLCRCINFVCSMTELCGGGCVTDSQCANWGGANDKCVCSWFSCNLESIVRARINNDRQALLDLVAATKVSHEKREQLMKV